MRPDRGGAGHGIEVARVFEAAAGLIVVSANRDGVERANLIDHFIWVGAVADNVAQTNHFVPSPFRCF